MARPTILIGPPVAQMTKEAATEALKSNPKLPKDAEVEIQQHAGHWIAAFIEETTEKTAAPFGGPSDDSEESPAPKSDDGGGDEGDSPPSPDDDGGSDDDGDGPPKAKKPGGDEHMLHQLMDAVNAICTVLGIPPVGAGGMGPDSLGPDGGGPPGAGGPPPGMGAGPPPPPHGHAGPPMGGPPGGAPPPQKIMHEKAGPPPPATFASVQRNHPWGHTLGQTQFFVVAEEIGNDSYETVEHELQTLAKQGGFRVARFTPLVGQKGERAVQAVIETPKLR